MHEYWQKILEAGHVGKTQRNYDFGGNIWQFLEI